MRPSHSPSRASILATVSLALGLLVPALASAQSAEATMLARINQLRADAGLSALVGDSRLDAAARVHTAEMASRGELAHVSATTGTPVDRVRAAGVESADIAENVAMHFTVEQAQASLEASPAHLTNMLGPHATHVGLSAIAAANGLYVTQIFARLDVPAVAATPPASDGSVLALDVPVTAPVAPVEVTPAPPAETAPQSVPATGSSVVVPPDPSGVVRVPAPAPGVTGYWICAPDARGGRWYYYPVTPGATGTLTADLSVAGPPPGYGPTCSGAGVPAGSSTYGTRPPPATAPSTGRVLITPWGGVRVETRPRRR